MVTMCAADISAAKLLAKGPDQLRERLMHRKSELMPRFENKSAVELLAKSKSQYTGVPRSKSEGFSLAKHAKKTLPNSGESHVECSHLPNDTNNKCFVSHTKIDYRTKDYDLRSDVNNTCLSNTANCDKFKSDCVPNCLHSTPCSCASGESVINNNNKLVTSKSLGDFEDGERLQTFDSIQRVEVPCVSENSPGKPPPIPPRKPPVPPRRRRAKTEPVPITMECTSTAGGHSAMDISVASCDNHVTRTPTNHIIPSISTEEWVDPNPPADQGSDGGHLSYNSSPIRGVDESSSSAPLVRRRNNGKRISRSRSDLTKRFSSSSDLSEVGARLSRNSADIEKFFNEMGIDRNILEPMLSAQYDHAQSSSTLNIFESASSILSRGDKCSDCGVMEEVDGGAVESTADPSAPKPPEVKPNDTFSNVEKNARIIKWLLHVHKSTEEES